MKFYNNFMIVLLISSFSFYYSCKSTSEPLTQSKGEKEVNVQLEIIPYTLVPDDWDSTFYQHFKNWDWTRSFDTTAANLLADTLKEFAPPVTDLWFPQEVPVCLDPLRVGSEVILKLSTADTMVHRLGFEPADFFPLPCVPTWRHYRFVATEKK